MAQGNGTSGGKQATALTFGAFEEFIPGPGSAWPSYLERLEFYFTANDITSSDKKRAVLCTVCGAATYAVIRSLCSPSLPSETDYKDIVSKLATHFNPKPSVIVQRFQFGKRDQRPGESVADYVAELRRLSEHCAFGSTLDDMLRDRLVCGLRDESLQRRLLAESNLTFTLAQDKAIVAEYALRETEKIRGAMPTDVYSLQKDGVAGGAKPNKTKPKHDSAGQPTSASTKCFRCGGVHVPDDCPFRHAVCHYCKQRGHIVKVCQKEAKARRSPTTQKSSSGRPDGHRRGRGADVYGVFQITAEEPAVRVSVEVNGQPLEMEVDSGAVCSVVNERTFRRLRLSKHKLQPCELRLRTYSQQELRVLGSATVNVCHKGRQERLRLVVVKGAGVSLLGRDWFKALEIEVKIHRLDAGVKNLGSSTTPVLCKYAKVFQPGLGKSKGPPVRVEVEPTAQPKFYKARPVPFALLPKVDEALDKLVEQGILEPVRHSSWATPIVPVVKKNGAIRVCGDYKSSVNSVVRWETYPLPTPEELFSKLSGCLVFSKLDLGQAYQQLTVDKETADLLTITTHRGLFRVTRLPFGVAVAVAIFQRYMEELLQGLDGVQVYLDDILVGGKNEEEHNTRLEAVLRRILEDGVRLNKDKCLFGVKEVIFLGHKISAGGIQPTDDKVKAIHEAPAPKCKKELQAFLGALNFYNRFLQGAAHTLEPLYRLLDAQSKWKWTGREATAFQQAKQLLQSSDILVHYDVQKPLVMACDASPYGLGVVLSHVEADGRELPVAYGSRTMTAAERNYAQIDREALTTSAYWDFYTIQSLFRKCYHLGCYGGR
ncbi:uncharacterized protein K02A2.6-like [Ornithodoros turicata]|uniref:uncharacterized protein K02A2.6-like n=1 Tax=Ornithodoros turicata TaxID=34597 RepID=UPI003138A7ED